MNRMTGWKTWAAGIGTIIAGVGQCLTSINWENFSIGEGFNQGVVTIGIGLGMIGIGHKVEKAGNANQ